MKTVGGNASSGSACQAATPETRLGRKAVENLRQIGEVVLVGVLPAIPSIPSKTLCDVPLAHKCSKQ